MQFRAIEFLLALGLATIVAACGGANVGQEEEIEDTTQPSQTEVEEEEEEEEVEEEEEED